MAGRVHVGDRVRVPFGVGQVEGDVLRLSGSGARSTVTVVVHIEGADGELVLTYPVGDVAPADAA